MDFLEDRVMLERIEESERLWTTLEQRFQALRDADVAKGEARGLARGLEQGLERGLARWLERDRQLLVRMVGRKFGPDMADVAAGQLAGISDADRLEDVGMWIIDCETGSELLARLQGIG